MKAQETNEENGEEDKEDKEEEEEEKEEEGMWEETFKTHHDSKPFGN